MKRSTEGLVMLEMVAVIVVMAIAGLCGVARAEPVQQPEVVSPVVTIEGDARLNASPTTRERGRAPSTLHVRTEFSTDTPGAEPFTLQKAVVFFPDTAGTNGRLFPSCSVESIERFNGNIGRCPKGSKIGSGTVKALAIQLGITANGRVTMFNGPRGKSITFNIQTYLPAYINESIEAPLTRLPGRGEKLTIVDPPSLQEIIDDVFVSVLAFDVTLGASVRVRGVEYDYIKARNCPTRTVQGIFDFKNWTTGQAATTTADAKVRCRVG